MKDILEIQGMTVQYGDFTALSINRPIAFKEGDRIGIIGNNGAGKSTFVKSMCGLAPYKGTINTKLKTRDVAVHLQENNYIKRMPVKTILEAILNTSVSKNEELRKLIDFLEFTPHLKKSFGSLSGGQKQKLTIIIVLFQDKPLVFFDEVTSALDFETRQKLMDKMNEWYQNKQNVVCVVSHYYDELENLCNKLLIIDKGRVVAFDDIDVLFKKYCGNSVITMKKNNKNIEITKGFKQITAPKHLLAFPCDTETQ